MNLQATRKPRKPSPRDAAGHALSALKQLAKKATWRGVEVFRCPSCRAPILCGLDDDECGWRRYVDWTPLDPTGELLAHLAGRETFLLTKQPAGNPKLKKRNAHHIAEYRNPTWGDIVPEHRCGATLPVIPTKIITAPRRNSNKKPPF